MWAPCQPLCDAVTADSWSRRAAAGFSDDLAPEEVLRRVGDLLRGTRIRCGARRGGGSKTAVGVDPLDEGPRRQAVAELAGGLDLRGDLRRLHRKGRGGGG